MKDITLSYSGGSGGFLLLHLLLLSEQFYTSFENNWPLTEIVQTQWNTSNHQKWKANEQWPNNKLTRDAVSTLRKIYFICNPFSYNDYIVHNTNSVIVYTDIASQLELAFYKKAHWFLDIPIYTQFKKLLVQWNVHYNNIKDPSWPKCISFRHINRLPKEIQQEILANTYTSYFLNANISAVHATTRSLNEITADESGVYNNETVHSNMLPYLKSADTVVKLQDIINSNGQILEELFEIPAMNQQQHKLIAHWKQLHPMELLEKIGIIP